MSTKVDYMALTPGEKRDLSNVIGIIGKAIAAKRGVAAAHDLQQAEDILRRITRRQFWANTE